MRPTYNTLPCPRNLSQWFGSEEKCHLCSKVNAGHRHILSGCSIALTQGRLRWRHNQVLRKLAEQLEGCRVTIYNSPDSPEKYLRVAEGNIIQRSAYSSGEEEVREDTQLVQPHCFGRSDSRDQKPGFKPHCRRNQQC